MADFQLSSSTKRQALILLPSLRLIWYLAASRRVHTLDIRIRLRTPSRALTQLPDKDSTLTFSERTPQRHGTPDYFKESSSVNAGCMHT